MKHIIIKILLICGLALLSLPAAARADVMQKDDFAAVSCGSRHTLALRNNGDLWAWGDNYQVQVGNSGKSDSESIDGYPCQAEPVLVLDNVMAMSAGETHSLAVKTDGTLWAWGSNYRGELANGGAGNVEMASGIEGAAPFHFQTLPIQVMEDVADVAAGAMFSLILKTDGTLWACGTNEQGQVGNGGLGNATEPVYNEPIQTEPVQIMDQVKAITAGTSHALAVKDDGSLWAWGSNSYNLLGNGGQADSENGRHGAYQSIPVQVFESGVTSVSASHSISLAVMEDGALWGWGANEGGFLLEGEDESIATPKLLLEGVRQAEAGSSWVLAIKEDNTLWGWGENRAQALNFNYRADDISPTPRKIYDNIVDVSSGLDFTMAVKEDGPLWGWGSNDSAQLAQPPGAVGLPIRVQADYPAWPEEPESEPEEEPVLAEEEPLPAEPERPSALPFIIGCGVLGAGGITGGLIWRRKKSAGMGVGKWRE